MTTVRTTILLDADLLDRLDRHVQRQRTTKTVGDRRGRRDVARRARGDAGVPVPGHRPQPARPALARWAAARAARGGSPRRRQVGPPWRSCSTRPPSLAAADAADLNHRAAVAWFERVDEPLLLGALGLASSTSCSSASWARTRRGPSSQSLVAGAIRLVPPTIDDLARAADLMTEAAEHRPRLADALLVATAERLSVRRVASFDRRPLAVFRPRHSRTLDFEP